jgi:hypothetical protein
MDDELRPFLYAAASFVAHVVLLRVLAAQVPALAPTADALVVPVAQVALAPEAEAYSETMFDPMMLAPDDEPEPPGGASWRAPSDDQAADTGGRYGVFGPADNPDPHIARFPGFDTSEPTCCSIVGDTSPRGYEHAPTAPWGRDDALGTDAASARGHTWGDAIQRSATVRGPENSGEGGDVDFGMGTGRTSRAGDSRCVLP